MSANVRDAIVERRRLRVAAEGHELGADVPRAREVPLVTFLRDPGLICEIKRRSPSRGDIDAALDPTGLAGRYAERGVLSLSVLTEEDHFAGSLSDLIDVKRSFPRLSVLRKDFLLTHEDVDVSYRAGADAILLIASVLEADLLRSLHDHAHSLGMAVLVELHEPEDFEKAATFSPPLVGINARDLSTFQVDLLTPIRLKRAISWSAKCVFESGAFREEDGRLVARAGFDGLLVGEAAVRDQETIPALLRGLGLGIMEQERQALLPGVQKSAGSSSGAQGRFFWATLGNRSTLRSDRPLVKICGITSRYDAELAVELGADIIGMIFADSPRKVDDDLPTELADLDILKVAVVVAGGSHEPLSEQIQQLLAEGFVDAVQFHGDESPQECASWAFPYYKAVRIGSTEDVATVGRYYSPRVLVDARTATAYGGTGSRISDELVDAVRSARPLWLAGGIKPDNVAHIVDRFEPELIDASTGLEREPGKKDPEKMRSFFEALSNRR